MRSGLAAIAVLGAAVVIAPAAHAQPGAKPPAPATEAHARADQLFQEGRALMNNGDLAAACPKFEESQRLDPGLGTLLNLALCVEGMGKIDSALALWKQAAEEAHTAGEDKRAATAAEHIAALTPRIPTLTVSVAAPADGIVVTVGGKELPAASWGQALPIDPGNIAVTANAPDRDPFTTTAIVREQDHITVTVPALAVTPAGAVRATRHSRHALAYGLGIGGAATVGVAAILGVTARSKYQHAFDDGDCVKSTLACDSAGQTATDAARSRGTVATVIGAIGLAAIAAGVVVYVLAPADTEAPRAALAPTVTDGGAGVVLVGRF